MMSQRFMRFWAAETIRQQESDQGPLADNNANRRAYPESSAENFVLQRAHFLLQEQQLQPAFSFYQRTLKIGLWLLVLIATFSGITLALNLTPQANRDISLLEAVSVAIITNAVFIIFWLIAVLRRQPPGGPGHWLVQGAHKFSRNQNRFLVAQAHTQLGAQQKLLKPAFSALTHGLWTVVLSAAFITLTLRFITYDYQFIWRTTLLNQAQIDSVIQFLHVLPSLFAIEPPLINSTTLLSSNPRETAIWLLACIFFYAIVPRVMLFIASEWLRRRRLRGLTLNWALPGYAELRAQYDAQQTVEIDPAPAEIAVLPVRAATTSAADLADAVLITLEWPAEHAQRLSEVTASSPDVDWFTNVSSAKERRDCLNTLAAQHTQGSQVTLMLAINPLLSPDRGSLRFIEALTHFANVTILLGLADTQRGALWLDTLHTHLPQIDITTHQQDIARMVDDHDLYSLWQQCLADLTEALRACKV